MSIAVVEPPTIRASGRKSRLSDEDFQDLANAVNEGLWASDNEPVPTQSSAYQRAQSVVKVLGERHKLTEVKTHVAPVNPEALDGAQREARRSASDPKEIETLVKASYTDGYTWAVGPRSQSEPPRARRS